MVQTVDSGRDLLVSPDASKAHIQLMRREWGKPEEQ